MDASPYQPPQARLLPEPEGVPMFYVVSARKFWVLMIATAGLFELYWFYRHWKTYKTYRPSRLWPIPRAIFAIFFTHELFRAFSKVAKERKVQGASALNGWATLYVVSRLIEGVAHQMAGTVDPHPLSVGISLMFFAFVAWPLALAQRVANAASGDPEGLSNAQFDLGNGVWIVIGIAFWMVLGGQAWLRLGGEPFWLLWVGR